LLRLLGYGAASFQVRLLPLFLTPRATQCRTPAHGKVSFLTRPRGSVCKKSLTAWYCRSGLHSRGEVMRLNMLYWCREVLNAPLVFRLSQISQASPTGSLASLRRYRSITVCRSAETDLPVSTCKRITCRTGRLPPPGSDACQVLPLKVNRRCAEKEMNRLHSIMCYQF